MHKIVSSIFFPTSDIDFLNLRNTSSYFFQWDALCLITYLFVMFGC